MKQTWLLFLVTVLAATISSNVDAALIDRGVGMIYDTDLGITWHQDANYAATEMTQDRINEIIANVVSVDGHMLSASDYHWENNGKMRWWLAEAWASQLSYGGIEDWRLPKTEDGPWVWGTDGTTTAGYNINSSEMGYMYYENMDGLANPGSGKLPDTKLFINVESNYWSGTEYGTDPDDAWLFRFRHGDQNITGKHNE